jgi:N-acetylglucosamine-6-phosphate deacetylase
VEDGVALRPDRSGLAGSVATADRLVRTMARVAGIPDAVRMMTATPARILGLPAKGRLAPGCDADIVLFDDNVRISRVFIGGKEI